MDLLTLARQHLRGEEGGGGGVYRPQDLCKVFPGDSGVSSVDGVKDGVAGVGGDEGDVV
jgi:hypothetical protein